MNQSPATLVSVVVLNYNYARFLPTTISSVLGQIGVGFDIEVIVVDDASTDASRSVIESFGSAVRPIWHEANGGQGAAINSGMAEAGGEIVWFLDADDALLADACATAVGAFDSDPAVAKFHSALAIIDEAGRWNGALLPGDPTRLGTGDLCDHVLAFRSHGWPPMSGNAYRRDALRRLMPVPAESYRQAADSFLNEQIAICGSMVRSERPVAAYRVHGHNQFAGRPVDLQWLRTKLEREVVSHRHLGTLAWQYRVPGYDPDPGAPRDVALFGYRMASLRLAPADHPSIARSGPDRRLGLAAGGIRAAVTNPSLHPFDRLTRSAWFVALAAAPSRAVPMLLSWYMPDGPSPPIWRRWRSRSQPEMAPQMLIESVSEQAGTTFTPKIVKENRVVENPLAEDGQDESTDDGAEVTIVVTPRERFGLSRASLESIYANTKVPFRLVYVDGKSPSKIAQYLRGAADYYGFKLITSDVYLSPNRARNLGLAEVDTRYVAFVDNDLVVTEGWLQHLIDCAKTTDAWVVGPLYFEGDPGNRVVHMAGGDYALDGDPGRRTFSTVHRMQGEQLSDGPGPFKREPVDFVEFHCMLVETEILAKVGGLDERLLSTREHLDLCMAVSDAGGEVFFEPSSRVTYLTPPPVDLGDVPFFLRRWSEAWNEASLDHFCNKHGIAPSYADRIVGMRARRQILLDPVRKASAKVLPGPVDRFSMRVMARLEREANRALFRLPDGT